MARIFFWTIFRVKWWYRADQQTRAQSRWQRQAHITHSLPSFFEIDQLAGGMDRVALILAKQMVLERAAKISLKVTCSKPIFCFHNHCKIMEPEPISFSSTQTSNVDAITAEILPPTPPTTVTKSHSHSKHVDYSQLEYQQGLKQQTSCSHTHTNCTHSHSHSHNHSHSHPSRPRVGLEDVLVDPRPDETDIYHVGTRANTLKVTDMKAVREFPLLETLNIRSCFIKSIRGVSDLTRLTRLELYDNKIKKISNLEKLVNLVVLDLSFNQIKQINGLEGLTSLETLYLANNRISVIENLGHLGPTLTQLDLGSNKLQSMQGLESLVRLKSLWLGRNKIVEISALDNMDNLQQLDVQSNRLTAISGLTGPSNLQELYLSHNGIVSLDGLKGLVPQLNTFDISCNRIASLSAGEGLQHLTQLRELWANGNRVESFEDIEKIGSLELKTIYLEHCPIAKDFEYRKRLKATFPSLKQIDAAYCR